MRYIKNYKISSFLRNQLKEQRIIYVEEIPLPLKREKWESLDRFGPSCWYELKRLVANEIPCIAIPYNKDCKNFKEIEFPRYMHIHLRNIQIFKEKHFHKIRRKVIAKKYNLCEAAVKISLYKFKKEIIDILSNVELTPEQYDNFFCSDDFFMDFFKPYAKI